MSETTAANGIKANKFEGDGVPFKGKLIGMEDVPTDREEKVCLDSMFKLKAVVQARGEHKQKIQLNLTMTAVKVIDDVTKVQLASHEIDRISFVVMDPRDTRAFGYVYNTNDNRHQFWAIKTERSAGATVLALKELFETAFEQFTNSEKAKAEGNQTTSAPVSAVPVQQPLPESTPVSTPQASVPLPKPVQQPTEAPTAILFDNIWNDGPSTTVPQPLPTSQQQSTPDIDLWSISEPAPPVVQPALPVQDPLGDIFGLLPSPSTPPTTTQQSASTVGTGDLFSIFTPAAPTPTVNTNVFAQPIQQTPFVSQQQPNLLSPTPVSPIAPPTVTSPFGEFDLLGDFSSEPTTKVSSFPPPPPARPIQ